jgi:flagellar motility protein MotE (MotC chaperone)
VSAARSIWENVDTDVKDWLSTYRAQLTTTLVRELKSAGSAAIEHEKAAFERRIREVASLQREQSIEKIKREIEQRRNQQLQYSLLEDANEKAEREIRDLQDELKRRQGQFGDLLDRLTQERDRILKHVMPHRFTLLGSAQVFPVSIEIRLPGGAQ